MRTKLLALVLGASLSPMAATAETYRESFECRFGKGLVNRPTPTYVLFSLDEYGRSALLHDVVIPGIKTAKGSGKVSSDSIKRLSISWIGSEYIFTSSGRPVASNVSRLRAFDLREVEFSIFIDRTSQKAIVRSDARGLNLSRNGNANGTCVEVQLQN